MCARCSTWCFTYYWYFSWPPTSSRSSRRCLASPKRWAEPPAAHPCQYFLPKDVLIDLWEEKSESGRNDILARYTSQNNIVVLNTSATDGECCGAG